MTFTKHFPATAWFGRLLAGRTARIAFLTVVFLLLALSIAPRLNSYLMARKFLKVLSGLKTVRIDETTEEELLQQVPYLEPNKDSSEFGLERERWYFTSFTNEADWLRFERLTGAGSPGSISPRLLKWADWLGFRFMSLSANVIVLDGKVSSIRYSVASEYTVPQVIGNIVSVRSVHGYWLEHRQPLYVTSTEDQSPSYRIKESLRHPWAFEPIESVIDVSYAYDTEPDKIAHVFQVDLRCFWSVHGCRNGREVLPLVWQDENAIKEATAARLASNDPCPDSLLAARVRYLPDLDVSLVEVTNSGPGYAPGADGFLYWTPPAMHSFRVLDLITGELGRRQSPFLHTLTITSPMDPKQKIPDPSVAAIQKGGRMLMFGNHAFESCSIVTATDSAEAAVRAAVPAPRRREDQIVRGLF